MMTTILLSLCFAFCVCADGQTNSDTASSAVETLVCIRHGEKPKGGLGQLNCQGLNRALALPDVLLKKYGQPEYIFAPNPTQKVDGHGGYYYVRPLMTIEPTAIRCGLPVNTEFGYREIKGLEAELNNTNYQNATIFVAWEHGLLDDFAKNMLADNGANAATVPPWPENDYDTIFLFKIRRSGAHSSIEFSIDRENLNGLSVKYPKIAKIKSNRRAAGPSK